MHAHKLCQNCTLLYIEMRYSEEQGANRLNKHFDYFNQSLEVDTVLKSAFNTQTFDNFAKMIKPIMNI